MKVCCPLCGTPFADLSVGLCDHEANWYRDWLASALAVMSDLQQALFAAEITHD